MTKNYITGAGGFIGRQLCKRLPTHTAIPHQDVHKASIEDCQRFFFLSTYGNMAQHDDIGVILQANVIDLASVLRKPFTCGLFVYVSSSSVLLPVQTPYSLTKQAGERIVAASGIAHCIIRPYSVTGVNEQREHLIPTLIRSCFEQTPMNLVMDATHDFIDVDDVVRGMIMLSELGERGVFELGTGIPTTNEQVLHLVEAATGLKAVVNPVNSIRDYDSSDWYCRNDSARDLGWFPVKTLADSIREMVDAYKNERAGKTSH